MHEKILNNPDRMTPTVVILAAGAGQRLQPITNSVPKTLVDVNGVSILDNALHAFNEAGIDHVRIVVGHMSEIIKKTFGNSYQRMSLEYMTNTDFASTNSMFSLHMGLKDIVGETWVLEGDIFFDPTILHTQVNEDISWYADSSMREVDGAYLYRDECSKATSLEIIRDLSLLKPQHCKSMGLLKLSAAGVKLIQQWLAKGVKEGKQNLYYDLIIAEHLEEQAVFIVDVKGYKWFEIDTLQDLEQARLLFR